MDEFVNQWNNYSADGNYFIGYETAFYGDLPEMYNLEKLYVLDSDRSIIT